MTAFDTDVLSRTSLRDAHAACGQLRADSEAAQQVIPVVAVEEVIRGRLDCDSESGEWEGA